MKETSSFQRKLHELATHGDQHCVSIYMPILRGEFVGLQNPTRLKNLLSAAETSLVVRGLRPATARDLMGSILEQTEQSGFWEQGGQGLAVFASQQGIQILRLPQPVPERCVVGRNYHITPLLPLETDGSFIVLELTHHDCRAMRGHRFSLEDLTVAGLPVRTPQLPSEHQRHVSVHGAGRHGAQRQSVITGQGDPADRSKEEIEKHFRTVDAAMCRLLAGSDEPLVIAALPSLAPIYRQVNGYAHLEDRQIEGDPESRTDHELHQRAWDIVLPRFEASEQRLLQNCVRLAGQDPSAFTLPKILLAAHEQRVATLLVQTNAICWGTFDPLSEQFRLTDQHTPGAEDLLNLAAIETLRHGGEVLAADLSRAGLHELAAAQFKFDEQVAPAGTAGGMHRH